MAITFTDCEIQDKGDAHKVTLNTVDETFQCKCSRGNEWETESIYNLKCNKET